MNFKEILELIDKVADRGIGGIEVEQAGTKVRIEGKPSPQPTQFVHSYPAESRHESQMLQNFSIPALAAPAQSAPVSGGAATAASDEEVADAGLHIITSPIVGTFYRAANPESEAFVNVGDSVTKGKVLCIIEAMKLMNEIESDIQGTIMRVYPQNGQPVEYGEKLFAVRT